MLSIAEQYRVSLGAALQAASDTDNWNARFVAALDDRGLTLGPQLLRGQNYPDGGAYQAPQPALDQLPEWPYLTYVVWKEGTVAAFGLPQESKPEIIQKADGPLLSCADDTAHFLTLWERLGLRAGFITLAQLNDKYRRQDCQSA